MSSLKDRIEHIEHILEKNPRDINVYNDLPCAIFRYDPHEEWALRHEVTNLKTRLENNGKKIQILSLETVFWDILDSLAQKMPGEGYPAIVEKEREDGFLDAQELVFEYLSDEDFAPFEKLIAQKISEYNNPKTIVFIVHAAVLVPNMYQISALLDRLYDPGTMENPTILFYPGSEEGVELRYMDLAGREPRGNYRVKIY